MNNLDLLIFGAGNLGSRFAKLYKAEFPKAKITALTKTEKRHDDLRAHGMNPCSSTASLSAHSRVLFSVPTSQYDEQSLSEALRLWSGEGSFIFVSSTSIYLEKNNGKVFENSLVDTESKLYKVEKFFLNAGAISCRMAGLFDETRGPQFAVLKSMKIQGSTESLLNLIHTDDAAGLSFAAMLRGKRGDIYLGCDNHPLKRSQFAETVFCAANRRDDLKRVTFAQDNHSGKDCDNSSTREKLEWQPRWKSFSDWLSQNVV